MATFGKTTDGGSNSASSAPRVWVSTATPASSGTVTGGTARIWLSSSGSTDTKMAIYADSAGSPGALLAESDVLTVTATTEANRTFTFSGANQITVTNGTPYWIAVAWNDPGTPSLTVSRDGTSSSRYEQTVSSWPTLPDPYGTPTANNTGPIDAYITYTVGGSVTGTASASFGFTATAAGGTGASATGTAAASFSFSAAASGSVASTFGKTTNGSNETSSSSDRKKVSSATPSLTGTVTSITVRGRVTVENTVIKGVIYADSAGAPGALLAVSDQITVNSTTEQNWTGNFSGANQIQVAAGTTYWIGWIQQDPGTGGFAISRGTTSAASQTNTDTYSDGPSDPFGSPVAESGPVDVYVTYTEAGAIPGVTGTASAELGFSADALGSATVRLPANPGEALWIGDAPGKNHFNIGIGGPLGGADHTDYGEEAIESGAEPPVQPLKFLLTDDSSAVQFGINVDDGRTSTNTSYPRSELRELDESGGLAAWDGGSGTHYMRGRSRVTHVAATKPWVVLFQIHGPSDDLIRVQTESGGAGSTGLRLRARRTPAGGGSEVTTTLLAAYELGDWIDWEVRAVDGDLTVYINGVAVLSVAGGADLAGCYFKAGCYAQSNTTTENGDDTQFFTVEIAEGTLQHWHTGWTTPSTPTYTGGVLVPNVPGVASVALGFTAEATGIGESTEKSGTAAASLGFTADLAGVRETSGTASVSFGFTASMKGPGIEAGTASASLGFAASASGARLLSGAASASLGFAASANGTVTDALGVPFLMDELGFGSSLAVEIAWGADLSADASTWAWTDITTDVRRSPGISTKLGRADEASTSQPASVTMVLDNTAHRYSLGGRSPNWPYVRRNTPVRVRIDPADGSGFRTVFFGFADGFTPDWDVMDGTVPVARLSASGTLRRLAQGSSPIMSAYRRAMLATSSVVAYWPFEEGQNATFAPAARGGGDMVSGLADHEFGSADNFDCSAPLVTMRSGDTVNEAFTATVDSYPITGKNQIRWLMTIPSNGLPHGCFLMDIRTSGTAGRWALTYSTNGGSGALNMTVYSSTGSVLQETFDIQMAVNGSDLRASVELIQTGSDVKWQIGLLGEHDTVGGTFTRTVTGHTVGRVTSLAVGGNDAAGLVVGHVTVQNQQTSLFEATGPFRAHRGEWPSSGDTTRSRLHRLCSENNVKLTRYIPALAGTTENLGSYETMGPQLVGPLLPLLRECETADQGMLWDGLDDGLSYTVRRMPESGTLALTIDAAAGELARPFEPVDDDQRNVNKAQVKLFRATGGQFEDVTGPLGTDTIGIYDTSLDVNNQNSETAVLYASWLVHLGTTEGYRFPSVSIDLRAAPHLAPAVLSVVPGHRIDVVNLDDTFAGFGTDTVSLIVEGIVHELTPTTWVATFQCSPASPWILGRVAAETGDTDPYVARADTDGSLLTSSAAAGATSISVTSGPLPVATDAFGRTSTNSWGSADLGGAYTLAGTVGTSANDFDVAGGVGTISVGAQDRLQFARLNDISVQDVDVAVTVTLPFSNVTGGHLELGNVMVRGTSLNDYYYAFAQVTDAEAVGVGIVRVVAGTPTEIGASTVVSGLTFTGQALRVRMQAEGTALRARVWAAAGTEPTVWHTEATAPTLVSGWVGVRAAVSSGNTNTLPIVFSHDNFSATTVDSPAGPPWTTTVDDYPMDLDVGGVKVTATACSGSSSPQTFTVTALPVARPAGVRVRLHDPRPIGL